MILLIHSQSFSGLGIIITELQKPLSASSKEVIFKVVCMTEIACFDPPKILKSIPEARNYI